MENFILNPLDSGLPISFFTASDLFDDRYAFVRIASRMDFHQILFVLGGSGTLFCQGREYTLSRGIAYYIAKGTEYSQRADGSLSTAFLTVRGEGMQLVRERYAESGFVFKKITDIDRWVDGISKIMEEYRSESSDGRLSALAYAFFVDFFENSEDVSLSPIERVYRHIEYHLNERLTLESLARVGGISVSTLCHDFKRIYGKTVVSHIVEKRLVWAQGYIIANPSALTKEVARLSGFDDVSYFCRAYKKKYGHSPSRSRIC